MTAPAPPPAGGELLRAADSPQLQRFVAWLRAEVAAEQAPLATRS